MKKLLIITLLLWQSVAFASNAEFQRGKASYDIRDYSEASQIWKPLAEQGHADAQYYLGMMRRIGEEAEKWYKKAFATWKPLAERGDAEAQYKLGYMYADAQYKLGNIYDEGHDVDGDNQDALEWYRKAAEQGHIDAQFALVNSAEYIGDEESTKWYKSLAKQGEYLAQYILAERYYSGSGGFHKVIFMLMCGLSALMAMIIMQELHHYHLTHLLLCINYLLLNYNMQNSLLKNA